MNTILYGAFGRHNFGDMLFPHIVKRVLEAQQIQTKIHFCDILSRDMTPWGGHNVRSIGDFFDSGDGLNVIHVGGQVGGCTMEKSLLAFGQTENHIPEIQKLEEARMDLGYLLSKSMLNNPNIFIANSVGGCTPSALRKFEDYDFVSFRDKASHTKAVNAGLTNSLLVPDCAVMTKRLFGDLVDSRDSSANISQLHRLFEKDYIAVQLNVNFITRTPGISDQLGKIFRETDLPIVFFSAGAAPGLDSLGTYIETFSEHLPKTMTHFFDGLNIWDICNLISNAKCVIGTSLHVRIISVIYARPRLTLFLRPKHKQFINRWDTIKQSSLTVDTLCSHVARAIDNHDIEAGLKHARSLEDEYVIKSNWSPLMAERV